MILNILYNHEDEFIRKEICSFSVQKIQDTRIMRLAGIFNFYCKLWRITQILFFKLKLQLIYHFNNAFKKVLPIVIMKTEYLQ